MAALELRGKRWRVIFCHKGEKHAFNIGEVKSSDAEIFRASTEELLRLLKRNMVTIPPGCTIEQFMFHRGNPPAVMAVPTTTKELTLIALQESYLDSQKRKLEETTLDGIKLHFSHLMRILGPKQSIAGITRADLQNYVEKRSAEWIDPEVYRKKRLAMALAKPKRKYVRKIAVPKAAEAPHRPKRHPSSATIKKEIVSLRTAWNWARRQVNLREEFPGSSLDYAKTEESLPFLTWAEAEARIFSGDDPTKVWDCIYLRPIEVAELLEWVKGRPVSPWVFPMFVFAAYTGARRSEIVRVLPSDVDLAGGFVTIREKKRDKRKRTTRRVPLTPVLKEVIVEWMKERGKGKTLFCKADRRPITPREATNYFDRALRVGKWNVLKGLHVFRHSFISALASKGVDQRIIDDVVGHSTEEQRRRYRHLFPDVTQQAVIGVFGAIQSASLPT